jgi:hypothetical protein
VKPIYLNKKKAIATLTETLVKGAAAPLNEVYLMNKSAYLLRVIVLDKHWILLPAMDR